MWHPLMYVQPWWPEMKIFRVFRILKSGGGGGEHNRYGAKVANSIENGYK